MNTAKVSHEEPPAASPREVAAFTAMWEAYAPRVMAYALRNVDADTAQDVLSETFLVAWRRMRAVPAEPLPWLLVVARNIMSNQRRFDYRQVTLHSELEKLERIAEPAEAAAVPAVERGEVLAALANLTPTERQALLLVANGAVRATDVSAAATTVHFARPDPVELEAYLRSGEPLRVAGAFTIDGLGGQFIDSIDGNAGTVIGLSLPLLRVQAARLGLRLTDLWRSPIREPSGQ